jgi:UDP-N-acetylglucosamine acyltransferase
VVTGLPPTAIHPTAVVGADVKIGDGVVVGPHVSLLGPMIIGDGVVISAGAALGGPPEVAGVPQDVHWSAPGQGCGVLLEREVVVREQVVIHQGTQRATTIAAGTWLLNRSYVAHDVHIGRECLVSAGTSVAGHCTLGDLVTLGMNVAVHQRRHVGRGAMVGMGAVVCDDIPPWAKAYGVPARLVGANKQAMRRANLRPEVIAAITQAYADGETDVADPWDEVLDDYVWWRSIPDRRPISLAGRLL